MARSRHLKVGGLLIVPKVLIWYILTMATSKVLVRDNEQLIKASQQMKPQERLIAFYQHSLFLSLIHRAGQVFRARKSQPSSKVKI